MQAQELNRNKGNIEITLTQKVSGSFLSKLVFGDKTRKTTISFDRLEQKITFLFSDGDKPHTIDFSDVFQLIIHQHQEDENDFRVSLILKSIPHFLSLYVFSKPIFGLALFQELELMILGENSPSRVYTFDAVRREFNL